MVLIQNNLLPLLMLNICCLNIEINLQLLSEYYFYINVGYRKDYNCYRQRGSDCTVLTVTGLVNEERQTLTPTEAKPLNRSTKTLAHVVITSRRRRLAVPNLVQIRPLGAWSNRLNITLLTLFIQTILFWAWSGSRDLFLIFGTPL